MGESRQELDIAYGLVIVVIVCALVVFGLYSLTTPSKEYTAIYFTQNDIGDRNSPEKVTFSFAIENHFTAPKDINYQVLINDTLYGSNVVSLNSNERVVQTVSIPIDKNSYLTNRVYVKLADLNQEIFFSTGIRPQLSFLNNLALIDSNVYPEVITKDHNAITLRMYWTAYDKVDKNYLVFVHAIDSEYKVIFQYDHFVYKLGKIYETANWNITEIVLDKVDFNIPANVPNGEYTILAGFYVPGEAAIKTKYGDEDAVIGKVIIER
jgi:hypothetical protein